MIYETLKDAQAAKVAPWDLKVDELSDFHVAVFQDRFPVTTGHLLFVPQYNTDAVIKDCFESAMLYGRRMVADGKCDSSLFIHLNSIAKKLFVVFRVNTYTNLLSIV